MAFTIEIVDTSAYYSTSDTKIVFPTITPSDALVCCDEYRSTWPGYWDVDIGFYVQDANLTDGQSIPYTVYRKDGSVSLNNTVNIHQVTGVNNVFYVTFWFFGGTPYGADVRISNMTSSVGTWHEFPSSPDLSPFMPSEPDVLSVVLSYFGGGGVGDPFMDIDVFTSGENKNKIITFNWNNLQNIPAGMYAASYQVRVGINYTAAPDASIPITELVKLPYVSSYVTTGRDTSYQCGYLDALQQMPSQAQEYAVAQGWCSYFVQLFHHDNGQVIDATYIFQIKENGEIRDYTPSGTGGTVTPHENTSPRPNDDYSGDTGSIDTPTGGQALSVDNLLTTSYACTNAQLQAFGQWLWNNGLSITVMGNQTSPIENILSCKRIPFDVASATSTNIWLGDINSGVSCVLATTNHVQDVGSITIPVPCGGTFMDERNNISIYLPYCGLQSIPTSICYYKTLETVTLPNGFTKQVPKLAGRVLSVEYVFDMIYGTCAALCYMYDPTNSTRALFGVFNGSCGVDIPLTQSNRASNELALRKDGGNMATGVVTSALAGAISGGTGGGLLGAAIGGAVNALQSAVSGALHTKNNAVNQETHFTTSSGFSSQIASFMPSSPVLFVEYTDMDKDPSSYAHENGYPCNLNLNMDDICGYTELDGSIEVSNIPCLEEERILLKQALMEGFYL